MSVTITGGDIFTRPNLLTNDFRFPSIVVRQGGTITWHNTTSEGHTMALVTWASVPKTTTQVDNCVVCNAAGPQGNGFPVQRTVIVTAGPGRYHYICTLHPWMQGTIDVVG